MILVFIRKYWLIMSAISALVLLRITNLSYNTLFLDEAIYIVVGKNFLQQGFSYSLPTDWIGGFPLFYPVLSAMFYEIGGSSAARLLSSLLGILSLIIFYFFTIQLPIFDQKKDSLVHALISAVFLGVVPVHLWLSRFAIYDMLSFSLLLMGVVCIQKAYFAKSKKFMWIGGVTLFLSFAAKYSAAFVIPFILVIPFIILIRRKNIGMIHPLLLGFGIPFSLYLVLFAPDLVTFFTSQTVSAGGENAGEIPSMFFGSLGIWYVMALGSLVIFRKHTAIVSLLLGLSCLPLLVHLLTDNVLTMEQNTLLAAIFIIPIAALLFVKIIQKFSTRGIAITILAVTAIFYFYTLPTWSRLESFWPNTSQAMKVLKESVNEKDMILAESGDVAVLALENLVPAENIVSPYYFEYDGLEGSDAYTKALSDKYFNYIQIDGSSGELEQFQDTISSNYAVLYSDEDQKVYKKNE